MRFLWGLFPAVLLLACNVQKPGVSINEDEVGRIIKVLSSDEMQGRAAFTPGSEKAALFIENEFKKIGLEPLSGENGFRQEFFRTKISPATIEASVNGDSIDPSNVLVLTDLPGLNWNNNGEVVIDSIIPGDDFLSKFKEILQKENKTVVFVDKRFSAIFSRFRAHYGKGRAVEQIDNESAAVFILGAKDPKSFRVNFTNHIEKLPLFNVAGVLPGKSLDKEFVVFSAHYDHIGIPEPLEGDPIANGADDDASGVTAVLALAGYFKKLNTNQRTLVFVAFTAEEIGGLGSRYFSEKLKSEEIKAMFNMEMIGKESKFGRNAAFITGFDKSNFGQILQKNLKGTGYHFYPDPYPEQNLFYRSDNATLAALGVPAHTISTVQIDKDENYHTVNDEVETLDLENITATIKAIAISSRTIISGKDTPTRISREK